MTSETLTMLGLGGSLLATAIASAWRMSALVAQQRELTTYLREERDKLDVRLRALDDIPELRATCEYMRKNHSMIPRLESRIAVLEAQAQHSKEWRRISRPDLGREE